jgi:hypothetical protein
LVSAKSAGSYAEPSQPVPYGQLNGYMKATPHQRTAMMSGAQTGSSVNTSAAMPTAGADASTNTNMTTATPGETSTGAGAASTTNMSSGSTAMPNNAAPMPGASTTSGQSMPSAGATAK